MMALVYLHLNCVVIETRIMGVANKLKSIYINFANAEHKTTLGDSNLSVNYLKYLKIPTPI